MTRRRSAPVPSEARGAVLIVALLITAVIALTLGSYLTLNLSTSRQARVSYQQNAAFHLAEAGAEEAVWSFNRANDHAADAWSGWTTQGAAGWRRFSGFDYGGGTTGSVKVYVSKLNPAGGDRPTVVALADVGRATGTANQRMIEVTLGRRSYFASGIVAKDVMKFAGTNATIDSWNSDPDGNAATPPVAYSAAVRNDRGSIATMAVQNNAMLVNQAAVWGYVATGGAEPEVGVNGSIRGRDTADGVRIDPNRVSTDFVADLPGVSAPLDGLPLVTVGSTLGVAGTATKWRCPSISLSGNQSLTIYGDVTLILTATSGSALEMTGNSSLNIPDGSSLTIYADADVKIAGNGLANANVRPITCRLFGTATSGSGQTIHIAGNGDLKAAVYAPNSTINVNGNGNVLGALVGQNVTFTGNAAFHYDESLAQENTDTPFGVLTWRELTEASERNPWQAVFAGW